MATIDSWSQPNAVQENNTGAEISVPNVQKGDYLLAISSAGGTAVRPDIAGFENFQSEVVIDQVNSPEFKVSKTVCTTVSGQNVYGTLVGGGFMTRNVSAQQCTQVAGTEFAITRAMFVRVMSDGPFTAKVTSTMDVGQVDQFSVYHYRPTVTPAAGKSLVRAGWALRNPNTKSTDGGKVFLDVENFDLVLSFGTGTEGDGVAITPATVSVTNLANKSFSHGTNVRTHVRLDFVPTGGNLEYTFTKLSAMRAVFPLGSNIQEVYQAFPSVTGQYWVAVPTTILSNMKPVYPVEIQSLIKLSTTLDPANFGLEYNYPIGNVQFTEDEFGQRNIRSWDEIHVMRFPDTISISAGLGDILLNDAEVEAFISEAERRV